MYIGTESLASSLLCQSQRWQETDEILLKNMGQFHFKQWLYEKVPWVTLLHRAILWMDDTTSDKRTTWCWLETTWESFSLQRAWVEVKNKSRIYKTKISVYLLDYGGQLNFSLNCDAIIIISVVHYPYIGVNKRIVYVDMLLWESWFNIFCLVILSCVGNLFNHLKKKKCIWCLESS